MTGAKLRTLLERHQLSQQEAAQLLRVAPRTIRRWLADDRAIPGVVDQFFQLLACTGYSGKRALKMLG